MIVTRRQKRRIHRQTRHVAELRARNAAIAWADRLEEILARPTKTYRDAIEAEMAGIAADTQAATNNRLLLEAAILDAERVNRGTPRYVDFGGGTIDMRNGRLVAR